MNELIEKLKSKPEYLYSVSVLAIIGLALYLKHKKPEKSENSEQKTLPKPEQKPPRKKAA